MLDMAHIISMFGAELNFVRKEIFLTVDNVHTDFYSLGILAKFT